MILPLTEVIDFIYKKGEHELRVEDSTRVRALIGLIGKMKDLLETPKEGVEEEFGDHGVWADNDSGETSSILSSDPSEAWSEYTVKSIASWKERTSWFFRLARGKKRSVEEMRSSAIGNHRGE
jgi:hypothetical protein